MNMPFTKEERNHAEKVTRKKVDAYADQAETIEELKTAQDLCDRQVRIESGIKKTILGLSPDTIASIIAQFGGILLVTKAEEVKVLTSKALGFVHKGRLR